MKQLIKIPSQPKKIATKITISMLAVLMVVAAPLSIVPTARADKYDEQIRALEEEISQYEAKAGSLRKKIGSLQDEINGIEREKRVIQAQIDLSQAKYNKLQKQIKETKEKIEDNQEALGDTIADLYVDETITPLEMLASSNNIGDYVDKQTYRASIRDALTGTIEKIKELKTDLEKKRADVKKVLVNQKNSKAALVAKENQRAALLRQTKGRESAYKTLVASRQEEKLRVQQEQQAAIAAAIAAAGGSSIVLPGTSGGYPWNDSNCRVGSDAMSYGGIDGNGTDGMGYGCRQCVSYVAWRTYKETGFAPINWGNANMWPGSARSAGVATGSTPRAGSAGVITSGQYGHIVWVESVNSSDGTLIVSQYNYYNAGGPGWGHYSKMQVPIGTYQEYIYF